MKALAILTSLFGAFSLTASANSWMHYDQTNTPIPSNSITSILHTESYTWVGTDQGLARYDGTDWEVFTEETSVLPNNHIQHIHEDNNGDVWLATFDGLIRITGQGWELIDMANSPILSDQIKSIATDNAGNHWFGTWGDGIIMTDGAHWVQYNTSNSDIPSNGIFKVSIDGIGNVWAGTFNSGASYFDGARWETFNTTNSTLPNNNVREILFENGNAWLGTDDGIAMIDNEGNWWIYTYAELGHSVHTIHQGTHSNGKTYFVTDGGLVEFENGQSTVHTAQNSDLSINSLRCISLQSDGNIWLGTANNGIDIYSPEGTLSAGNLLSDVLFSAYPNPTTSQLNIELGREHSGPVELKVHNAAGQLVLQEIFTPSSVRVYPLNLDRFPAGYFSVSILSDSGFTSKRVLKL